MLSSGRLAWGLVSTQLIMAIAVMAVVAFAPPARGAILIVSLNQENAGQIARWAVEHDARLLGVGPVPNSLVVDGARAALARPALKHGGLLLTGAFTGCGRAVKQ